MKPGTILAFDKGRWYEMTPAQVASTQAARAQRRAAKSKARP
jgi:hypothetical protein